MEQLSPRHVRSSLSGSQADSKRSQFSARVREHLLQRLLNWYINLIILLSLWISPWASDGGGRPPGFWKFHQKRLFSWFRVGKSKFHHFWPPLEKFWKYPLAASPWKKSFRRQFTPHNWVWNRLQLSPTTFAVLSLVWPGWTELTSEIFCSNGFLHFGYQKCFFFSQLPNVHFCEHFLQTSNVLRQSTTRPT